MVRTAGASLYWSTLTPRAHRAARYACGNVRGLCGLTVNELPPLGACMTPSLLCASLHLHLPPAPLPLPFSLPTFRCFRRLVRRQKKRKESAPVGHSPLVRHSTVRPQLRGRSRQRERRLLVISVRSFCRCHPLCPRMFSLGGHLRGERGGGAGPFSTPCVTFRLVVAPLRGPGRSPVLPFACCVGSLLAVGRCGRCSCWCRFRVRGAQ